MARGVGYLSCSAIEWFEGEMMMWDKRYSSEHYVYGLTPNEFLEQNFRLIPKGPVLCLAEGEGRNAVFLAKMGYTVTAVDTSSVGLDKARRLAADNHVEVELICEDLGAFDFGAGKWSGIVSIFCHLPELVRKVVHKKVVMGLKRNGVLLLESYTPEQLQYGTGGPPREDLLVSKRQLKLELVDLHFNHLEELERSVEEGTLHTGVGAVVQAIAMKK